MITFKLLPKIDRWANNHRKECKTYDATGAQFEYRFLPTGICEIQTVKCLVCGKEYTEYDD